ncbi:MAG: hypothetical protein J6Y02_09005 [Pseudobutyrivibrio sp.]|nr:hypothetical protein [Pseudobutyrivibrio sp.]
MKPTTELVIRQYQNSLFTLAFSICKNVADAEDVVQDTFIKYHTKNLDFDNSEHVKAWLIRVCMNRSKDVVTSFCRRNKECLEDYIATLEFEQVISGGGIEITDCFNEDGVCYLDIKDEDNHLYLTILNDGSGGYSMSQDGYLLPSLFSTN